MVSQFIWTVLFPHGPLCNDVLLRPDITPSLSSGPLCNDGLLKPDVNPFLDCSPLSSMIDLQLMGYNEATDPFSFYNRPWMTVFSTI